MTSLPPAFLKPLRSGLSVPITLPNISTDCRNNWSNCSYVVVVQSQVPFGAGGVCWTHVPRYSVTSGNGAPTLVLPVAVVFPRPAPRTSPANEVPHVGPYQRKSPLVARVPFTILATTAAS